MKRMNLAAVLLIGVATFGIGASGQDTSSTATSANADASAAASQKKAHVVVQQAIAALGGDAWIHRRDAEFSGRRSHFYQGKPTGDIIAFWEFRAFPNQIRYEFTKKRDVAQIFSGDKGWEITYKGKNALPAKQMEDYQRDRAHSLDVLLQQWANDPSTILIYEGQTMVERHLADKVSLINSHNDASTIEFDGQSHLPIRRTYQWRDPLYHDKNEDAEEYDDYHAFDGIATPFTVTRYHNGDMTNQIFLFTAKYNHGVPAGAFDPDATAAKLKK
jgi:hypothetical protein